MMNSDWESLESSSGRFLEVLKPLRDPESNWSVDLAKYLEEYWLKICSGQISSNEDSALSVNFAEAALLLQGSAQVYSKKVEYLYSLVLHALNFISQKSQEDQEASSSPQTEANANHLSKPEEDDPFWGLDDIPVEPRSLLDSATKGAVLPNHFVRPPANIVVLEGDCLDAGGDAGELESYLLATNDLYRDFILLDSYDADAVDNFLDSKASKGHTSIGRGNAAASKVSQCFLSPFRQSAGTGKNTSARKKQDANFHESPHLEHGFEPNDCNFGLSPPAYDFPDDRSDGFGMGNEYSELEDLDGFHDPWKPLDPHEPGNLKVKPYKQVKADKRVNFHPKNHNSITVEFPLAKPNCPISPEITEIWEARFGKPQSFPLFAKLRQSLVDMGRKTDEAFYNPENKAEETGYDSEDPDFDMPDVTTDTFNDEDEIPQAEKPDDPDAHTNLEDLCRSHLDALLSTLAENEKQTELATRVSMWKQRIEQDLEEQDARPPFDIHKYGDEVLEKLSMNGNGKNTEMSFRDVVSGQEKHDIARTFSALLQLVNDGDVDLVRSSLGSTSTCYSAANPFDVRLLRKVSKKGILLQSSKKRAKSPWVKFKSNKKGKENYPCGNGSCRFSINNGKPSTGGLTPEGKKRRRSPAVDMHFVGN